MQVTICTANCVGQAGNCSYPNRMTVVTPEQLQEAVKKDHVCAEFKGNYRSVENFIRSDVIVMDIDNDHTEVPAEWITPEKLEELFPNVEYLLAPSRHHLLDKEGKSARPRYHMYFPISEITDAGRYANLKKAIQSVYSFFDGNALDAARFIFGAECDEVIYHDGWMTVDEEVDTSDIEEEDFDSEMSGGKSTGPILEGSRNNTMSRFAGRILKKYGDTEKAHEAFLEHARKCDPPLPDAELKSIWNSAVKFYRKSIVTQDGYVPPEEYNADFEGATLKPEDYSDIGQAKVLVREYGEELKYTSATDFLRFDGDCWREDKQLAIGAVEEFLDLQLQDAMDEVTRVEKALEDAGVPKASKVYQEHMIIAYGGGANGKSTFWNTIFRVLGNYAGKLSAEALTMNCKRNVKPEMAELKGKRLIISSEMEEGMRLNTAVVKQLCSTDEIQAEKKYKDPFSFVPSHTLVLYTNHLPKVGANDDGIWRRLIVIPFNAKITGKSDIKNYADYLFEHAGPAIMNWIIEGAKKAIDKDFHTDLPDVVEAAIKAYREDNDWLGQFLEECCEMDPSYKEKSGELYQTYRAHCMQNGEYIRSTTDFYSSMDKAGFNRIRKNTGVQVVGLKLKEGQDFLN